MVLGPCACCAGMLLFGVICVVCVWRRLCGLVLCIQTTGRLNTKRTRLRTLGGKVVSGGLHTATRASCSFSGLICMARLKPRTNERSPPESFRLWRRRVLRRFRRRRCRAAGHDDCGRTGGRPRRFWRRGHGFGHGAAAAQTAAALACGRVACGLPVLY